MIRRELGLFLLIGSLTVILDFIVYWGAFEVASVPVGLAKTVGFLAGTVFAYFANRAWTFGHKSHRGGSAFRFIVVYVLTLSVNVGVNGLCLALLQEQKWAMAAAFIIATGLSAVLNFVGMKFFVFSSKPLRGER
jgi:putative flippase GtrA